MDDDITQLLNYVRAGDKNAEDRLISLVYCELRQMAAREFQREHPGHTLQPTALVHEVYLKLTRQREDVWNDRAHFFGVAAHVMRHVLIDHARASRATKRGGAAVTLPLEEGFVILEDRLDDLLVIEDALAALEQHDARAGRVVTLRFFGGMDLEEVGVALDVSSRTVKRDWSYGRAWLKAYLSRKAGCGSG